VNKKKFITLFILLLFAGLFSLSAADNVRNVRIPLPDQEAPKVTTVLEPPTINIKDIEDSANEEAENTNKDYDILVLQRLQTLVDKFISGEIYMNEQDMTIIELFLERRGNVAAANK
jgi:hypothetical protein